MWKFEVRLIHFLQLAILKKSHRKIKLIMAIIYFSTCQSWSGLENHSTENAIRYTYQLLNLSVFQSPPILCFTIFDFCHRFSWWKGNYDVKIKSDKFDFCRVHPNKLGKQTEARFPCFYSIYPLLCVYKQARSLVISKLWSFTLFWFWCWWKL